MSHTGCWVWDVRSAAPVYWSAEMSRICGRDPARGLPSVDEFRAIHALEDWSDWLAAVRRSVQDRTDFAIECRLVIPNGDVRQVRITGRPIAGAANEVTEIIGSTALVTGLPADGLAQSRTEDAPLLPMIDLIPGLVWSALRDGSNEYCNRTWLDYTGHTVEKARGWGWIESVHPDDLERLRQYWLSVVATCEPGEIEARLRRFDGEYRWFLFRARPHLDSSGTVIKWYGTNTDIEDRKQAEDALRGSERELRQLVEAIPALVWRGTAEGDLDYTNWRLANYLGKTAAELTHGQWAELVHPDDREATVERWQQSVTDASPYQDIYRLRRADGHYRWVESLGDPVKDGRGRVLRWYGLLTDIEDRKRAEDALRESEQHFRRIVDSIPALMCTMTAAGVVETVNRPILDYFGRTVEELRDWAFNGAVHEDDIERVVAQWRYSIESGTAYDIEHRIRRADGVYRWHHVRGQPVRDAENRILRWYVLLTDIEDRRRAEEAIRTSERELRQLVDHVPGYIATANARGEHDYANKKLVDYTGASNEDTFGLGFIDTIHPDEQKFVQTEWLRCATSGQPMDIQHRLRRFDGAYRWFHVRVEPFLDVDRNVIRWYGLLTDIHDRKLAEEAVRASETRLRLITETIPAILTSRDDQGKLDYVNRRLEDYIGKSGQEIIDSWVSLIHPDDRESLLRVWRDSQETGERYELDYRMLGANGEYRWFQVRGAPLLDQEGRVLRWYAVITDIEEARRAREALLKSQTRLARMSQITAIAELSGSIAHEVNQPLAAILANANACLAWLSGDPPNLERARGTAEKIIRNANSAAEIVRRVRALFKQTQPALVLSDINDTVLEVLNLIASDFRDADIGVDTELAPDLPMIAVDRIQIQQILMNLARNAIEAMEGVRDRPRKLSLVTRCDGVEILMQVRDSGCGIANPASIFDPFFTTKETGMGMGLAICRSIVEAHGGRLWATPNEGAGTTFSLTLPLHSDAAR